MPEVEPDKIALIKAKLREKAAQMKRTEALTDPEAGRPPVQEGIIGLPVIDSDHVTFVGPNIEDSFMESTLMDLMVNPRKRGPAPERGLNDIYERIDTLAHAANFLMTVNSENKCRLSVDVSARMGRIEERLDKIDNKEVTVGVGKLKLTLKWSGLITILIALSQINVPWIVSLLL